MAGRIDAKARDHIRPQQLDALSGRQVLAYARPWSCLAVSCVFGLRRANLRANNRIPRSRCLAERVLNGEIDDHLGRRGGGGEAQQPQRLFEEDGAVLEPMYPLVFFDALLGQNPRRGARSQQGRLCRARRHAEGTKDILGLWIETSGGAKFWLRVMTELKNRGVEEPAAQAIAVPW